MRQGTLVLHSGRAVERLHSEPSIPARPASPGSESLFEFGKLFFETSLNASIVLKLGTGSD